MRIQSIAASNLTSDLEEEKGNLGIRGDLGVDGPPSLLPVEDVDSVGWRDLRFSKSPLKCNRVLPPEVLP